jgi:hypothetical protein
MAEKRVGGMGRSKASSSQNLTLVYASVASDLMQRLGDAQAAQMGPPTSKEDKVAPATTADRVKSWNSRKPEATDEAMMEMARQKYQEHITAGMDPETAQRATAEDLTHFRYDQRLTLYTYGQVGFAEQVEAAARMAKLAARESTPDPLLPAPAMPSAAMTNAAYTPTAMAPELPPTPTNLPMPMLPGPGIGAPMGGSQPALPAAPAPSAVPE